jgi:hypothetical protein
VASRVGRNVKMGCRRIMVVRRCALLPNCDLSVFLACGPFFMHHCFNRVHPKRSPYKYLLRA